MEQGKKQRLTSGRSLLLGFGGFEWSASFSPSVTSSLSLPAVGPLLLPVAQATQGDSCKHSQGF